MARCAGMLRELGVRRGSVVSVQLPNWREFVVTHLAVERLGAVTNPLLPQYREHELIGMQRTLQAAVAIFPTLYGLRAYAAALGLDASTVLWMPSPVTHATGLQWGVRTALYLGCTLVLQEQWDPHRGMDLVQRERCTLVIGATSFVHDLQLAAADHPGALRSLRQFVCAGAPVPEEVMVAARRDLGVEVLRAYGMSEHFISTMCRPGDDEAKRLHTDGRPIAGTEISTFDQERSSCPHRTGPRRSRRCRSTCWIWACRS